MQHFSGLESRKVVHGDVRHSCEEEVRADKVGDSKCM